MQASVAAQIGGVTCTYERGIYWSGENGRRNGAKLAACRTSGCRLQPEPRQGLRSGHIPGSRNIPFTDLLDPKTKTLLPAAAIADRFRKAGIDLSKPVVTSCGSGVTAAVLALGLHLIGHPDVALYDGSWAEWGRPGDTPVEP